MGTKGRKIVDMDVDALLVELNKAFADEWLAYFQYWVGARVAVGPMRGMVAEELEEHANEELEHAGLLAERILQLGGTPLITPEALIKESNCGYEVPSDPSVAALLKQNIEGEQCAIAVYNKLLKMVEGKDVVTYHLVLKIMTDEIEHEEDLQAIEQDLKMMKK